MSLSSKITKIMNSNPKPITARPTGFEQKVMEQFEPLSDNPVENMAGFIVRGVVDIARYRRTIREVPEKLEHYTRLQRCAQTAMQVRFANFVEMHGVEKANCVGQELFAIDWPQSADIVVPVVRTEGAPYAGTEQPVNLQLMHQAGVDRAAMPA